jgi:ParB family transcriptional regulator, chromosome partitioning protein
MKRSRKIASVPIAAIKVLNPREHSQNRFKEIVKSIDAVGLKRPITVSKRENTNCYELACGAIRMEAFSALNQAEIPAILVAASTEECILMSLVENIARRRNSPVELIGDIGRLAKHYTVQDIAAKLDLSPEFVRAITYLLKNGEDRLISAVERGVVPPTLGVEIAKAKTPKVQGALLETFISERHTAKQIGKMRKVVEQRHRRSIRAQFTDETINPRALVRAFQQETGRQQIIARKADLTLARLVFIINALKTLLSERMFTSILRREGVGQPPLPVLHRMSASLS